MPLSWSLPVPTAMTLPSCGFSLALSGMMMLPWRVWSSSEALDHDVIVQRAERRLRCLGHGADTPLSGVCE